MIIKEILQGPAGVKIREGLQKLIGQLDDEVLMVARKDTKTYDDVRYAIGVADGVRFALQHITDLGKSED